MKHLFSLTFCLLTLAGFSQNENTLLYRISGNGITQPSYLYGTIHMSCDATINAAVKKALDETSQMYLELDMDDPEMQSKMMNTMSMKDGATISSLLSADDFVLLDNYLLSKMKVSAKALNTFKPLIISSMFLPTLLDCPMQSIESELVRMSVAQKEPVYGLETVEEQMAIFDQIPYQLQAEELIKSVKNNFKADKIEFDNLLKAYLMEDLNEMQRLTESSESAMMKDYRELLLVDRNKNWIPLIERISRDKPTFFGVGAAHLMGNEGVLNLLRGNGYLVEPVKN